MGTTTPTNHPYIDYPSNFHNQFNSGASGNGLIDYSGYVNSGNSITFTLPNTVTYDGNSITSRTDSDIKWIMIKFTVAANSGNTGIKINNTKPVSATNSANQKVYNDYHLFYMEQSVGSYVWKDVNASSTLATKGNTPWLDVGNTNWTGSNSMLSYSKAQSSATKGLNNGCLVSNYNTATNFINSFNATQANTRYIAIGLLPGKTVDSIELTVGTN